VKAKKSQMNRRLIFTLFLFLTSLIVKAEGYTISVKWEGLGDSTIFLAHYYNSNIYIDDTLHLDQNGKGVFTNEEKLHEGLYMLYLNGSTFFDLIVGADQNFEIHTTYEKGYEDLSFSGAIECEDFLTYQRFLRNKSDQKKALSPLLKDENKAVVDSAYKKLNELDLQMSEFMSTEIERTPTSMYGVFLRIANQIKVPEPPVEKNHPKYDSIAWFHSYNYRRDNYLNGIDFTDERILFTPMLKNKLETYFNKILIQNPDTIIVYAQKLLRDSEPNIKMYQYTTQFLINNSVQSKIMGMEAVFVAVADEVYLRGKATWADSTTIAKIAEEAYLTRPNLIGKIAPDIVMENNEGESESLYLSQGEYTILVFYEYDCGHCKKDIPALYNDVYMKLIEHNIEVYAVCMNDDKEKWTEFIKSNELEGWHHLWDPKHYSKFRFKYNVKTSPTLYLLDVDKKIIAKKLDNSNLAKYLTTLLNQK
jgi:peroxiredoxin